MWKRVPRHVGDAEYGPSCPQCSSPKALTAWLCHECWGRETYVARRRDERGRFLPYSSTAAAKP